MPGQPLKEPDKPDAELVESGDWGCVRHARRTNGDMEAKVWLESASLGQRAKFSALFARMASTGQIRNIEKFRKLSRHIYEFKSDADRILTFQHGNC